MNSGETTTNGGSLAAPARKRLVRRLLGLAWEHRRLAAIRLGWELCVQVLLLGGFVYSGVALDVLRHRANPDTAPEAHWPFGWQPPVTWGLMQVVGLAAGLVLALTLARSILHYVTRVADERLIQAIVVSLRERMYAKLQRLPFSFFDVNDSGGLINRVTGDAQSVRQFIQGVAVRLIVAVVTLALFLTYMARAHVGLTLAVLALLPAQVFVMTRYTRKVRPHFMVMRETMDRVIQTMQEAVIGAKVVKGFGQERQMIARFDERNQDALEARMATTRLTSAYMPAIPATSFFQMAILLAYGGHLVRLGPEQGGILLGTIWVFLGLMRQLSNQIDAIIQTASTLPDALTGAERVFELLDAPVRIASPAEPYRPPAVRGAIRFDGVSFRYGDGPEVLRDVSFEIQPGETVAIVGPAGSGKSTLLQLVPRFHDATAGRVLIDGMDVREWDLETLRRNVGTAFQEAFLFSNTVAANVAFGRTDATDEQVWQALRDAAADEFVQALEKRELTVVGERGLNLSGGERQRLSLARALLVEPPILLLDDTTAAVDAKTEVRIREALDRVMRGRTTLIVAHRLSTLRRADRIVVIERGQVTAIGSHDQLMQTNAHYREAAMIQMEIEAAEAREAGEAPNSNVENLEPDEEAAV